MIIGGVEGVCSEKPNNANTNNPQPHHSQIQHNFKAIKAQFTFAVIFFLAQLRYMGIEQGDCRGGLAILMIWNFGLCLFIGGGVGWVLLEKDSKPS